MIQSLTRSPVRTEVVVLDVPMDATRNDVLRFIGTVPNGTLSTDVVIADDFSGVVSRKGANVTFWTD